MFSSSIFYLFLSLYGAGITYNEVLGMCVRAGVSMENTRTLYENDNKDFRDCRKGANMDMYV